MSETFNKKRLGKLISLQSGYAFSSSLFSLSGKKLVTPKNFTKNGTASFVENNTKYSSEIVDSKFICKAGDLLILLTDLTPNCELLGKPALLNKKDGEVLLNQRIVKIEVIDSCLKKQYLAQFFLTSKWHKRVKETASGTTVRHSSNKILNETYINLPSPQEQQKIADFLTSVDSKISQLTEKHLLLIQYKKGVMRQIFSQQLRFKGDDGSEFGEWEEYTLLELSDGGFSNGVFNDPRMVGSGYRLINVKDMYSGNFINYSKLTLLSLDEKTFKKNQVQYGDIFFTRSSLVPSGIAFSNVNLSHSSDITYDGHLIKLRPKTELVLPQFLAYYLRSHYLRKALVSRGKQSTMTTIGQEDIKDIKLNIPSNGEQQKIAQFLQAIDAKIDATSQQLEQTKLFKKGLLQQMFV